MKMIRFVLVKPRLYFCFCANDAANHTNCLTYGIQLQQFIHVCLFYACACLICHRSRKRIRMFSSFVAY